MASLHATVIFRGYIECITGLHIGSSSDKMEIGGVDSPVIRHPHTKYPYIPGSSLKGKLRTLLEFALQAVPETGEPSAHPDILRIFGAGITNKNNSPSGPGRIIVRDCHPTPETIHMWENEVDSSLLFTEYKAENTLNRLTSAANPRFIERVVPGSTFAFEIIYLVFTLNNDLKSNIVEVNNDIKNIIQAMRLLEHNYIGKSGSRGYGKIKFHCFKPHVIYVNDYKEGTENYIRYFSEPRKSDTISVSELNFQFPNS
jgi:CRISPR-associated protein Csm3